MNGDDFMEINKDELQCVYLGDQETAFSSLAPFGIMKLILKK